MDVATRRENEYQAMKFEHPDRIPLRCGILPSAWIKYREELATIVDRYPEIFGEPEENRDFDVVRGTYVEGRHTDVWGCVWENVHHGREAIVTSHPVPERSMVHDLEIPEENAGLPHGFMYLRLQDLRGFEELMIDFAEEPPELQILIDKVLAYDLRQVRIILDRTEQLGQILYFGDDLGMQRSLPMSPAKWRRYLKPCFRSIYALVKKAGHYVFMHTDGHIVEIIPDLEECGVDVVNPQVGANGVDALREVCYGRICVDLDLDRQSFPFFSPQDIDDHIHEAVAKLGSKAGGLWLHAEIDDGVPLETVDAICRTMVKYSTHYSA